MFNRDLNLDAEHYFEAKLAYTTGPFELKTMLNERQEFTLVDVRASEDYTKGHIPGAINLPMEQWEEARLNSQHAIVFYCYAQQCHLAAKAAYTFARKGYSVMELEGGWKAWTEFGMEVETLAREEAA